MNVILVDTDWDTFLPLTYTRPVSKLLIGAYTIAEKWELYFTIKVSYRTQDYLSNKFKEIKEEDGNIYINSSVIPNKALSSEISSLTKGNGLEYQGTWVAFCESDYDKIESTNFKEAKSKTTFLRHWWNLFYHAETYIKGDFEDFYHDFDCEISSSNTVIGDHKLLKVHDSVVMEGVFLNTKNGPIIIEEGVEVMEGSMLRGPLVIKNKATIKMGAKIYGASVIGEGCKIGGEVKNSVFLSYSNKAHEGYIGNAVVGAWVNMGANTSMSNMKNTLGPVKVWSIAKQEFIQTHKQFLGGCIGDYAKFAIQTKLTTGSIVGIFANVLEEGFPHKFIPNFYWSNSKWFGTEKMDEVNERMHLLSDRPTSEFDAEIFEWLHNQLNNSKVF